MAFTLPTFNLTVDVYSGPWASRALRLTTVCNLARGRRGTIEATFQPAPANAFTGPNYVLFPALTDVRDLSCNQLNNDMLELPQGSGRWYAVEYVDDIGKGFANEHRLAICSKASQNIDATRYAGLYWPSPIP